MKHTALFSLYGLALADLDRAEQWLRCLALLAPVVVAIVHCIRRPPRRQNKPKRIQSKLPFVVAACGLALLVGSGCAKSTMADLVRAAGSDTNSVSISIRSPWGSAEFRRNAQP
jgi:hypothetical protein